MRTSLHRVLLIFASASAVSGQNSITIGTAETEYPSYQTLSVRLPITGDDNRNAVVRVRYRVAGAADWSEALPLFRVMPETVLAGIQPHFAGSIFDLRPGARYQIELNIADPDGGSATQTLLAQTRSLPVSQPARPRPLSTSPGATGNTAFPQLAASAQPGDVITLQEGVYQVQELWIGRTGTPENPILIRGIDRDKVILDGGNCSTCIMFGLLSQGHIVFEDLTIRNIGRAFRITADGSNYVFHRIRTTNVASPFYASTNPSYVTISDCVLDGPSVWPSTYESDPGRFSNFDAIALGGSGHVIAHNRIQGFSDSVKFFTLRNRGQNVYGNDIYDTFDNAIELDLTSGNSMAYRNRITNTYMPLSVQPVIGGPAYLFRNVMYNVVFEVIKYHAVGGPMYSQSSGVLAYHNTSVNTHYVPLGVETGEPTNNFQIKNNIFLGRPNSRYALSWGTRVNQGLFDYNLYYPDAEFWWRDQTGRNHSYPNLGSLQSAAGEVMERNGMIATPVETVGLAAIPAWELRQSPNNLYLRINSPALNRAQRLPNINDGFVGKGPDPGAHELGCEPAWYGPRPKELTEANQLRGCESSASPLSGTARLDRIDSSTRGNWTGVYGSLGKLIAGDPQTPKVEWTPVSFPAPGTTTAAIVEVRGRLDLWQSRTQSDSALVWATSQERTAAAWTSGQDLLLDVRIPAGERRALALYFAEFGFLSGAPRKIEISVVDNQHRLLLNAPVEDLAAGTYLVFHVEGHVKFRIIDHSPGGSGPLVNGIFIDEPRPTGSKPLQPNCGTSNCLPFRSADW